MMFSTKTHVISTALFFSLAFSAATFACSTDGWDAETGMVAVGQPSGAVAPDINGVPRFEELCALAASGAGHVQTNAPSHSRVRARMYAYPDITGSDDSNILVAYSSENGTGGLFTLAWDNGDWVVDASGNGGTSGSAPATGNWDLIEFDWNPGSGTLDVYVNADATTDSPTFMVNSGGAATMESIRIGLPDGHGGGNSGNFYVDSVEMRNETAIGPLLNCDADSNLVIELEDAVEVIDEFFSAGLAPGTPDCDLNGVIELEDAVEIIDIFFGP
ncbi:MAG TPA: hypothetical protein VJ984_01335 [Xanthomonadales bacterium]|nr:hypothetical protein [Xanthomonadales bacterium]